MTRPPINPGAVDWSGENPGMYLKDTPEGKFVSLVSLFRVVWSPHGRGHACFVLQEPHVARSEHNVCVTDNELLARWLAAEFVARFGAFRDVAGLPGVAYRKLTGIEASAQGQIHYTEHVRGNGLDIRLSWRNLGEPYMVEMPVDKSATGKHEMFSLFVDAAAVETAVNGQRIAGVPQFRDMGGRRSSTAFLAFSETWVRPR